MGGKEEALKCGVDGEVKVSEGMDFIHSSLYLRPTSHKEEDSCRTTLLLVWLNILSLPKEQGLPSKL